MFPYTTLQGSKGYPCQPRRGHPNRRHPKKGNKDCYNGSPIIDFLYTVNNAKKDTRRRESKVYLPPHTKTPIAYAMQKAKDSHSNDSILTTRPQLRSIKIEQVRYRDHERTQTSQNGQRPMQTHVPIKRNCDFHHASS